jgi:hypothetical protein
VPGTAPLPGVHLTCTEFRKLDSSLSPGAIGRRNDSTQLGPLHIRSVTQEMDHVQVNYGRAKRIQKGKKKGRQKKGNKNGELISDRGLSSSTSVNNSCAVPCLGLKSTVFPNFRNICH